MGTSALKREFDIQSVSFLGEESYQYGTYLTYFYDNKLEGND